MEKRAAAVVWSGRAWGRWLLVALAAWRAIAVVAALVSSTADGGVMRPGATLAVAVYLGAVIILASPLGLSSRRCT